MTRMRICRITDAFPPPWSGLGPGPYSLSKAQHRLGNDIVVVTKWRKGCDAIDAELPFPVIRTRTRKGLFDLCSFWHFLRLHRKQRFDLIHTHGISFFWTQLLNRVFPIIDVPVVVSVHNIRKWQNRVYRNADMFSLTERILERDMSKEKAEILKRFPIGPYPESIKQEVSYRFADMCLPVSETLAERLVGDFGVKESKVAMLPNGVDVSQFGNAKAADLERFEVKPGDVVLLFVGRLLCTKDITSLILAIDLLREKPIKLVIIGHGPWSRTYKEIAIKRGLNGRIVFIENVPYHEISGYYKSCDIFILTSFSEGMPKVVLEAMAAGKPVLGADVEGVRELIKDNENGRLFSVNSPESIAGSVLDLIADRDLMKAMGESSLRMVHEQYSWQKVAEKCQEHYDRLLI